MPETEVRFIQESPNKNSNAPNIALGVGVVCALGTAAFLTFGRDLLPEIGFETENISSGQGNIEEVYVTSPSPQIRTTYQTGWARVEDDSPGFLANPFAQEIAINQIKVMHDADTMRVYERFNEKIGVYAYIAFFDEKGNETSLAPKDLYLRPSAPETCILTAAEDGSLDFEQCTDEDDPNYRGARDFKVDSGGNINMDTSMIEKVAPLADIFRINNSCINGNMLGGVYEGLRSLEDGPDLDLMQERNLALLRMHYRRSVGEQLNIPLDRVLFREDVEYFTRETDAETFEMGDGMDYKVLGNMLRPDEPRSLEDVNVRQEAIELDSPIAIDIIKLRDQISDVKLPDGLKRDSTVKEARAHEINTVCYPGSDYAHAEFEQLLTDIKTFGAVCLPKGLKPDGSIDLVWAEEQVGKLNERVSNRIGESISDEISRNCGDTIESVEPQVPADSNNTSAFSSGRVDS
jgi:hypothetical protein